MCTAAAAIVPLTLSSAWSSSFCIRRPLSSWRPRCRSLAVGSAVPVATRCHCASRASSVGAGLSGCRRTTCACRYARLTNTLRQYGQGCDDNRATELGVKASLYGERPARSRSFYVTIHTTPQYCMYKRRDESLRQPAGEREAAELQQIAIEARSSSAPSLWAVGFDGTDAPYAVGTTICPVGRIQSIKLRLLRRSKGRTSGHLPVRSSEQSRQ